MSLSRGYGRDHDKVPWHWRGLPWQDLRHQRWIGQEGWQAPSRRAKTTALEKMIEGLVYSTSMAKRRAGGPRQDARAG